MQMRVYLGSVPIWLFWVLVETEEEEEEEAG